jgi:hypothetical protein
MWYININTNMIRRTLLLPEQLDQRLLIASRLAGKSLSDFVREALDSILANQERERVKRMYAAFDKMIVGAGDPNITDASTTIDEVLYGEKGAWRGTMPGSENG